MGAAGPAVGKGYGVLVRRPFWMKRLWGARCLMENGDEIPGVKEAASDALGSREPL